MQDDLKKFALGTAQFGFPYGISNTIGTVVPAEVQNILTRSSQLGISTLDTASSYGNCEEILGKFSEQLEPFEVFTKLSLVPDGVSCKSWITQELELSLQKLRRNNIEGILLHTPGQLLNKVGVEIYATLLSLKNEGHVNKIGISVYSPNELDAILPRYKFDFVQLPMSIFDQRFFKVGWLHRLNDMGILVHARSLFLQGLLLIEPKKRPKKFAYWNSVWEKWDSWLTQTNQTPLEATLGYARSIKEVDKFIIGVHSYVQFCEVCETISVVKGFDHSPVFTNDENLLLPQNWNKL